MNRLYFAFFWAFALVVLAFFGCSTDDKADAFSAPSAGLRVDVRGHLVLTNSTTTSVASASSSVTSTVAAFSGVSAQVFRVSKSGSSTAHTAKADVDANDKFVLPAVPIKPWEDTYELRISDATGRFQTRSLALFALAGDEVNYGDIQMTAIVGDSLTEVLGSVAGALGGEALSGVSVTLVDLADESNVISQGTTGSNGSFRFESIKVGSYKLKLNGAAVKSGAAPEGYLIADREIPLSATPQNLLGRFLLVPTMGPEDLSIVLSVPADPTCAGQNFDLKVPGTNVGRGYTRLSIASGDIDINHAFGYKGKRWEDIGLSNPAGFGVATPFWPAVIGARSAGESMGTAGRPWFYVPLSASQKAPATYTTTENGKVVTVIEGTIVEFEDNHQRVETIVMHRGNLMSSYPKDLAYYYNYKGGGERYPVGTILHAVSAACSGEIDVYREKKQVGHFAMPVQDAAQQRGEITDWAPVLIEYGFTSANPTSTDSVYFELLPLTTIDLTTGNEPQAYERRGGATDPKEAWKTPPAALLMGAGGNNQIFLAGTDTAKKSGVWHIDASKRTMTTGQDSKVPDDMEFIAMASVARGAHFDSPIFLYKSQSAYNVRADRFDDPNGKTTAFTCGQPVSLGVVAGTPLVGTTTGLSFFDCAVASATSTYWLVNLVATAPSTAISFISEYVSPDASAFIILGARDGSVYFAEELVFPPKWTKLGVTSTSPIVSSVGYNDTVYLATANQGIYKFDRQHSMFEAAVLVGDVDGKLPTKETSAQTGKKEDVVVRNVVAFSGKLYIGTTVGIWEFDASKCDLGKTSCKQALRHLRGFPSIEVSMLATGVNRFYALTQKGLFEILAP